MNHHVHLGITGLRRTGKTVFLTSLIYQLSELGSRNLARFSTRNVTLQAARIEEPRNGELEPFPYAVFLDGLRQSEPRFPPPTVRESGCCLQLYFESGGTSHRVERLRNLVGLGRSRGRIVLHLHDYPGEYLLDAGMTRTTFDRWSQQTLVRMRNQCPDSFERYLQAAADVRDQTPEEILMSLRRSYGRFALTIRDAGLEYIQPAMTLLGWYDRHEQGNQNASVPDAAELPFVPLPEPLRSVEALREQMQEAFQEHVEQRVRPFVSRIQRCRTQLVLVDVLRILRNGVEAYNDTSGCLTEILRAYHDDRRLFRGISRVLFAATKADHSTQNNRANMTRLLDDLVFKARGNISSSRTAIAPSSWFTSLRATEDAIRQSDDRPQYVLLGLRKGEATPNAYHPGEVPSAWPDDEDWTLGNAMYAFPEWEPKRLPRKNGAMLPHINLDQVIWNVLEGCF